MRNRKKVHKVRENNPVIIRLCSLSLKTCYIATGSNIIVFFVQLNCPPPESSEHCCRQRRKIFNVAADDVTSAMAVYCRPLNPVDHVCVCVWSTQPSLSIICYHGHDHYINGQPVLADLSAESWGPNPCPSPSPSSSFFPPRAGSGVVRIDPLRLCRTRRLNQAISVLYLSMFYRVVVLLGPVLCIVSFRWYVFCLSVVLVKFQYLPSD